MLASLVKNFRQYGWVVVRCHDIAISLGSLPIQRLDCCRWGLSGRPFPRSSHGAVGWRGSMYMFGAGNHRIVVSQTKAGATAARKYACYGL